MGFPDFDIPDPLTAPSSGRNVLRTGLAWLTEKMKAYASEDVVYERDGDTVACRATFGQKPLKLTDDTGGTRIEWTNIDFLIPTDGFTFDDGARITPERGDLIHVTQGAEFQTYAVTAYQGEPPWRWSDPHGTMLRIHAKLFEVEPYS